jgi:hypothetical protein
MRGHQHILAVVILAVAVCGSVFADGVLTVDVITSGTGTVSDPYIYEYTIKNPSDGAGVWGFDLLNLYDWLPVSMPTGWELSTSDMSNAPGEAFWIASIGETDFSIQPGFTGAFTISSTQAPSPGYSLGTVYDYSDTGAFAFNLLGPGPPPPPPPPPPGPPERPPDQPNFPTPEPGTWMLLASSALGLLARRRRSLTD